MSKAVLVLDMPKCCNDCMFHYDTRNENDDLVDKCMAMNDKTIDGYYNKYSGCPLKPLPKKQSLTFIEPGQDAITMGWNACIETIEGTE